MCVINRTFINLDLGRIMLYAVLLVHKRGVCVCLYIYIHVCLNPFWFILLNTFTVEHTLAGLVYIKLIHIYSYRWIHDDTYSETFYPTFFLFTGPSELVNWKVFLLVKKQMRAAKHALSEKHARETALDIQWFLGTRDISNNDRETYVKICLE